MKRIFSFIAVWLSMTAAVWAFQVHCPLHSYATCYDTGQVSSTGSGAHKWHCTCGDDAMLPQLRAAQEIASAQAPMLHISTGSYQRTITELAPRKNGKMKTVKRKVWETSYTNVPEQFGKLLFAQTSSYYAGANTQYQYIPPACLNNIWCHILIGDPTSTTQAVYLPISTFVIQGPDYIYAAYDRLNTVAGFVINSTYTYGINSEDNNVLYLVNGNDARTLTIYQRMLTPTPTPAGR